MNLENVNYFPWIALVFISLAVIVIWLENKFFKMIKTYWFYGRSIFSYLSTITFLLGMGILLLSLLDFRGPEEKIKSGVPTERTIILIDTSASMLAEDVKPSRLQKAALIAKHFARKAAGHQLSIVAFAEIQKKIVPFTNDLDLIDARLDSIKNLRNQNGSSALTAAIQESIQYFKETGEARGNILVITDGEETAADINLKIPDEVRLGLVGVGTNQGGRIPLDDGRGFRYGYKKTRGQDVITKLEESFFKKIVSDVPNSEYWLANSYTLPSDEILAFFKGENTKGKNEQDMVIKPVLMEWLVVPAIILLTLSYVFKAIRVFSLGLLLLIAPIQAQEKEPEYTPELIEKMQELEAGELSRLEKIKLADELHHVGATKEALTLYEENLKNGNKDEVPPEAFLNYGTALLESGEGQKGLKVYDDLYSSMDQSSTKAKQIKEMMEKNVLNFFKVQEQKKEQQKKDKENKDQNKDQQQGSGGGQGNNKENQQGQNKNEKNPQGKPEQNKDKKDEKEGKQDNEDKKDNQEKDKQNVDSDQEGEKKKLPPKKVPPKLKQLLSDDRQLQLKIIEQSTRDMNRRHSRENKDW